jgi:hypothetical protein
MEQKSLHGEQIVCLVRPAASAQVSGLEEIFDKHQ